MRRYRLAVTIGRGERAKWSLSGHSRKRNDYGDAVQLGLNLGYGGTQDAVTLAKQADRLGYRVVWVAEAYGTDAVTVLSWIAAHTERIDVGSAILQMPARTPT